MFALESVIEPSELLPTMAMLNDAEAPSANVARLFSSNLEAFTADA